MIPIRILARILHPLSSKTRLVLALTAYMDESGHSADPALHFAGMAGFIAPGLAWDEFEKSWSAILDQFGLEWFHMNEFAHFEGPFEGWDEKRRRDLFGQLIGVIKKTRAIPTGAVVSVADFNSLSEGQRAAFRDPYFMAFQQCTRGACLQAYGYVGEKVSMVYAYQSEYGATDSKATVSVNQAGGAEQLWHVMKRSTVYRKWMGSYALVPRKKPCRCKLPIYWPMS